MKIGILVKKINNKPQSELDKKQRIQNVKNVYKVQKQQKIEGKRIILLDDIYTTGSTAKECAKMLKQSGSKSVAILTIAKDFLPSDLVSKEKGREKNG